MNRPFFQLEL